MRMRMRVRVRVRIIKKPFVWLFPLAGRRDATRQTRAVHVTLECSGRHANHLTAYRLLP